MIRKILKLVGFVALVVFIIGTLAFTTIESRNIKCSAIEVVFDDEELVSVDKDKLIRMAKTADPKILNKTLEKINAEKIEKEVSKHPSILHADVYKLIVTEEGKTKGVLVIKVKNRRPVMRVVTSNGSFYVDEEGVEFPVASRYANRIMVASGSISEKFAAEKLLPFVEYVNNNDFWHSQIEQIYVEQDGDVLLTPLIGGHIIEMGDLDNYEIKLMNMKAFYKQVLSNNNWDKYSRISLKYNNQVVAKKR